MDFNQINKRRTAGRRLKKAYRRIEALLYEIGDKQLSYAFVTEVNRQIAGINNFQENDRLLAAHINQLYEELLTELERDFELVPKNYFQQKWLLYGVSVIGLPIGLIIAIINHIPGNIILGLPIGLLIGLLIGIEKDKNAKRENRQLQVEHIEHDLL
ncbi:hypothetical protein [Persicobacter psychrovividus]|uniref:Uncharacterized protein n=1 Tax=Persicobacter psychrovividus TaxID=387638 RepID=A0ABN6LBN0_9BACT|nr:hypothetical protein PEPS_10640 [Persicobacter psychrovividus]